MKTKKRHLSILLSLVMVLGLMPGMNLTAYANQFTNYNLVVGGTQVTSENAANITGANIKKGTAHYDASTNTLTLKNADIDVRDNNSLGIYYTGNSDLTIALEGENKVSAKLSAIHADSAGLDREVNITISGGGSLTATSEVGYGIGAHSNNTITIDGGTVKATGSYYGIYGYRGVTIENGDVTASGINAGIYASYGADITINGGTVNATATAENGVGIQGDNGSNITINSGTVNAKGSIGIDDRSGSVTIKGGTVNANEVGASYIYGIVGNSVAIEGGNVTATATGDDSYGIAAIQGTTISGGTVTASGSSKAIYGINNNSITGVGWTNTAGTEGKTFIPAGTSGQELDYLKVQFPAKTAVVTFKVVNGSWNDGTSDAKTVSIFGPEGTDLKLAATDITAVGDKPKDGYTAGSWDVTPSTARAITADTTYTYTYAQKEAEPIEQPSGVEETKNPDGSRTVTEVKDTKDGTANITVTNYSSKDEQTSRYVFTQTEETTVELTNVSSKNLKTVVVPSTVTANGKTYKVTRICKGFLKNCKQATKVDIGKNINTIDKNAFNYGKNVKNVIIRGKLKKVGKGAFKNTKKNVIIKVKTGAKTFKKNKTLLEKSVLPKKATVKRIK